MSVLIAIGVGVAVGALLLVVAYLDSRDPAQQAARLRSVALADRRAFFLSLGMLDRDIA